MPAPELAAAVRRILTAVAGTPAMLPIVLIDGFSGAGKSTLADALIAGWPAAHLVRLEAMYPGWDGLAAASWAVHDDILQPLSVGRPSSWRRWDWTADAPAGRHSIDPARPLVIEGAGALSVANRRLATLGVWVDLDEPTRRARALARDGAAYSPHWDRWAAQERAFARRERPRANADLVIARREG